MVGLGSSPCRAPSPSPPTVTFFCASGASPSVFWVRRCVSASGTRNYKAAHCLACGITSRSAAFSCAPHCGCHRPARKTDRSGSGRFIQLRVAQQRALRAVQNAALPSVNTRLLARAAARAATSIAAPPALRAELAVVASASHGATEDLALPPGPGPPIGCWPVLSPALRLLRRHQVLLRLRRDFWPSCCSSAANQLGGLPTCKQATCGGWSALHKRQSEHPQKDCQLPKKKAKPGRCRAGNGIQEVFESCGKRSNCVRRCTRRK